jgi:hypothetical protein
MKVWLGKDIQTKLAAEGLSIPMVRGTSDVIQNPFYKALALEVNNLAGLASRWTSSLDAKRVASSTTKLWPSPLVPSLPKGDAVDRKLLVPTSDLGAINAVDRSSRLPRGQSRTTEGALRQLGHMPNSAQPNNSQSDSLSSFRSVPLLPVITCVPVGYFVPSICVSGCK